MTVTRVRVRAILPDFPRLEPGTLLAEHARHAEHGGVCPIGRDGPHAYQRGDYVCDLPGGRDVVHVGCLTRACGASVRTW